MRKMLFCAISFAMAISTIGFAAKTHGPAAQASVLSAGPKIRVLLEKEANSAILEAKGPYKVVRRDSNTVLSSGKSGKRFVIHALQDGLRWGEEYPDVYQVVVIPFSPDTTLFVDGIQYKGAISIYHVRNNKIAIVNEVAIEDYLKSTLAVSSEEGLSKEASYALAILARTDAYSRYLSGKAAGRPWDITAKEAKYFGYGITYQTNKVESAVDWTRYMVLESTKEGDMVQNLKLPASKAEELADRGFDAKKILSSSFPHTKLGVTVNPDQIAIR